MGTWQHVEIHLSTAAAAKLRVRRIAVTTEVAWIGWHKSSGRLCFSPSGLRAARVWAYDTLAAEAQYFNQPSLKRLSEEK
jgi:hypothetical protein